MSHYPIATSVHPAIEHASRQMILAGWRVTSLIRPNSEIHAAGKAGDFAPWIYTPDKVGPRTAVSVATMLWNAASKLPTADPRRVALTVVAEPDHIHCELSPDGRWRVGTLANSPGRPLEIRPMKKLIDGSIILEPADITRDPDALGARAIGDPLIDAGDPEETGDVQHNAFASFEMLDPEIADLVGEETGDYVPEIGGIRRKKKKKVTRRSLARALASSNAAARAAAINAISQIAMMAPASTNDLLALAAQSAASPGGGFPFIYPDTKGLVYSGGTIAANRKMRPADAMAYLAAALGGPKFPFRNFPFTVNGSNFELNYDSALQAVLPLATVFPFVGLAIYATPTALNAQLDGPLSVTVGQGAGHSMTANFVSPEKVKGFAAWIASAQILADEATPMIVQTPVVANATGNHLVTVQGLNTTAYTLTARFLMPGDHSVAHIIRALELTRA